MKPTAEDFAPRRDGWFEHAGTWNEVTVGTVLADPKSRTKRWEVVAQSHGQQVQPMRTLWMRVREQTTGAEFTIEPRLKTQTVTILTQDPADTATPPQTVTTDTEAILLLVRELGATHLASRDNETGEITCPDYVYTLHEGAERGGMKAEMEHMRFAHGIDTAPLEALPFDERIVEVTNLHARAHNPAYMAEINRGGFPHRHVPEDLTLMTGIK